MLPNNMVVVPNNKPFAERDHQLLFARTADGHPVPVSVSYAADPAGRGGGLLDEARAPLRSCPPSPIRTFGAVPADSVNHR